MLIFLVDLVILVMDETEDDERNRNLVVLKRYDGQISFHFCKLLS